MASNTYIQHTADGKATLTRRGKQGRKPSTDPTVAITIRIRKSELAEMSDPRHEIAVAIYNYRTQKLLKS